MVKGYRVKFFGFVVLGCGRVLSRVRVSGLF